MAKDNKSPIVTKKHLARVERERLQTRTILIISGVVIALVVLLIGWGFIQNYIVEPNQTIVSVDGTEIDTRQFQALARFNRGQLVDQYAQYYQFMQMFGGDTTNQSSFIQTLSQISFQLEPEYLGQNTIDSLIEDTLVRKEAANRGITVSEQEVDKALEEFLGFYPEGTPTPAPTDVIKPTSTLSALQMTLIPSTATPMPTETPAEQPTEAPTETLAATSETSPTATTEVLPTPTEYTAKLYQQNTDSYLNYTNISQAELRWIFESQLYRQKVIEAITADLPKEADQVWARQIVVADEETAKQVIERLNAGEDFVALAAELSTDEATKSNGGDLGWRGVGQFEQDITKIIFNLNEGQISEPLQTATGWYIYQLLGHEVRPIPTTEYQNLLQTTYQEWLTTARAAAQVDIKDIWLYRVPTEPDIPPSLQLTQ
jgi:parvulin-like peptidyl-prolyl isomerase